MAGMIDCPYCGKLTDPKLDNCPHCGGDMLKAPRASQEPGAPSQRARAPSHTCPHCHASVGDGDIICGVCNTNLLTGQKIGEEAGLGIVPARRGKLLWFGGAAAALAVAVVIAVAVYVATRDPVKEARQLTHQNNYLEAIDVLTRHLEDHPDEGQAQLLLGKLYWETNQFSEAADAFEAAATRDVGGANSGLMAVLSLASVTGRDTRTRQVAVLKEVVKAFPQHVAAAHLLALTQGALGRLDDQVTTLQRVAGLVPDDGTAHQNLGIALALQGSFAEAERALSDAERSGGHAGDVAAAQGFVASLQGDADATVKLAAALERGASVRREASVQLGTILVAQKRYTEAMRYLKEVVDSGEPGRVPQFLYALCLAARRSGAEALHYFEILGEEPGLLAVEANIQAAHLYLVQNDLDGAREAVERAVGFGGGGAVLETLRGRIQVRDGQIREAQNAFKRAIQADPSYAPAHLENGLAYVKREVFTEGVRELVRYLSLVDRTAEGARAVEVEALVQQLEQTLGQTAVSSATAVGRREGRSS